MITKLDFSVEYAENGFIVVNTLEDDDDWEAASTKKYVFVKLDEALSFLITQVKDTFKEV